MGQLWGVSMVGFDLLYLTGIAVGSEGELKVQILMIWVAVEVYIHRYHTMVVRIVCD